MRRVHENVVAVEKQKVLNILCVCVCVCARARASACVCVVCSFSHPVCKACVCHYIANRALSGCAIFFHIIL
jgi:hypothetical protein